MYNAHIVNKRRKQMNEIDNDDWYDFENDRPWRNPPVGTKFWQDGDEWIVVAHHMDGRFIFSSDSITGKLIYGDINYPSFVTYKPLDYQQKMQERNKLVKLEEQFVEDYYLYAGWSVGEVARNMIKLGWRKENV